MTCEEVIRTLSNYETELTVMLSRFSRSRNGIYIQLDDDARLRQLAIELIDFLNDTLGNNSYSSMIANYYNEGISRGSASYASVESIKGVVSSIITRLKRNPKLLFKKFTASSPNKTDKSLDYPNKVTIGWLVHYVPVKYWTSFLGIIFASFLVGIQASRLSLVQEIFKLRRQTSQTSMTEPEQAEITNIFAEVSKDGSTLRSNNFPWEIKKSKDKDGNILYTIVDRRGDATAISVVPDYPEYTIYQSFEGMVIKFSCAEDEISDFTIKVKY